MRRKTAYAPELGATSLEGDAIEACDPQSGQTVQRHRQVSRTLHLSRGVAASLLSFLWCG